MQASMFRNESLGSGYRLQYIQVLNWGTFGENKVWTIKPDGKTSLLTGANGSGKTTLVDVVLTLLVPTNLRAYNQSSGAESKADRTEESYVLGAYGQTQEEGKLSSSTQYLRDKDKDYSVLLATFYNEGLQHHVTLGQIRWFMGGGKLNKEYFTATKPLDIASHDIRNDRSKNWKDRLKREHDVIFHESFSKYQAYFLRAFGMRSEKALNLFAQTVGIKVLGKLDEFIRHHMLEPGDPEADFRKLQESFDLLLSSYRAFEKARKQLELLQPVAERQAECQQLEKQCDTLDMQRQVLPAWFATQHLELLKTALRDGEAELGMIREKLDRLKESLEDKRGEESGLRAAIEGNEIGRQIKDLEKAIREKENEFGKRKRQQEIYNRLATALQFITNPDANGFLENRRVAEESVIDAKAKLESLQEQKIKAAVEKNALDERYKDLDEELQSLLQRKTRIPKRNIDLRQGILEDVGATEEEIPFIGELLKIRDKEAAVWESAAEQLLHNYALRLLVPDKFYQAVNRYVNNTRLDGRIIYLKVDPRDAAPILQTPDPDALYEKLEIKPHNPYYHWLENQLANRFDHKCTTSLDDFRLLNKALTPEGLSKEKEKHEKDDRPGRWGPENYVLGWDNKEKIKLLKGRMRELEQQIKEKETQIKGLNARIQAEEKRRDQLRDLLGMTSYEAIDWQSVSIALQQDQQQLEVLQKSSDQLKTLEEQLKAVRLALKELDGLEKEEIKRETRQIDQLEGYRTLEKEAQATLAAFAHLDLQQAFAYIKDLIPSIKSNLKLENVERLRAGEMAKLSERIVAAKDNLSKARQQLNRAMTIFRNPPDEVRDQFRDWTSETRELGSDIEYVGDYLAIHNRIKTEKLLEFEKRFREYLDEKMVGDMANFQTALNNRLDSIEENIRDLNGSLRQIDFHPNPKTYIQLVHRPQIREDIRDFRHRLKSDWKFDTGEYERSKDISLLEKSFAIIKSIIESLREDENYRKRVLDVRNWLMFHATEHFAETNEVRNVYESTGHLSGGEKAQITYTILGAALAYQFGIDRGGHQEKSFRFIVVDEAFSKLDPEKSKYLMELCKQLHLQLLVVTPLDKIHIAEPYIHACHYVENKNKKFSRVYDLSMEEYRARKREFEEVQAAQQ
jgi:uncharacterized protein YPO0396